jgi:kynurenine formamidase
MKRYLPLTVLATLLAAAQFLSHAQSPVSSTSRLAAAEKGASSGAPTETPIGEKWWPSRWGADDERGAANLITPEKVLEATELIRTGQIYPVGRVYEYGMPLPGKRHFSLTIPGSPSAGPEGENRMVSHDEMFSGEIGQVGTQMDGLGHVGVRLDDDDYFYNGFRLSEFGDGYGLKRLGVENIGAFFTRGVLIDVAGYKRVERLEPGYAITPDDLKGALKAQGVAITRGDVVLVNTGHGKLWMKDNETFGAGEPGLGLAAAQWLIAQDIALVGSDNWAIEVVPHEDPKRPFEVHQWTLTKNGIYHLENLDLEKLAADRVYEFAFVFSPVPIRGATGSPGNPICVR